MAIQKSHPQTPAQRRAWIIKKQAAAEIKNIKQRIRRGKARPTDVERSKELELIV